MEQATGLDGALTIDQLIFKGTHNSYACRGKRPPWMNHPPQVQIDDFGVWCLELDFSIERKGGAPAAVVGHNGPGDRACWGYFLTEYLAAICLSRSLTFRPVFICFDIKRWRRSLSRFWQKPVDSEFSFEAKWECGLGALREVCGEKLVVLEEWLEQHERRWPGPLELAGKVVLFEPNKMNEQGELAGLRSTHADHCVAPNEVEDAIETGRPFERDGAACEGGARALRLDQYQAGWTFDYGVPPNPLVVDPNAPSRSEVEDSEGRRWRCAGERSHGQLVGEQGTYRFPFTTIERAVERAKGFTSATGGVADPRRAGQGWTILVSPGSYDLAQLTVDFPLTLRFEG